MVWCDSGTKAVQESLARAWLGSLSPYSPSRAILRVLGWAHRPLTVPRGVSDPNPASQDISGSAGQQGLGTTQPVRHQPGNG